MRKNFEYFVYLSSKSNKTHSIEIKIQEKPKIISNQPDEGILLLIRIRVTMEPWTLLKDWVEPE